MIKKIGLGLTGLAVAIAAITAIALASEDPLKNDLRTVVRGILSPGQVSVLMDFHGEHGGGHHGPQAGRIGHLSVWRDLELSRNQQERLLDLLDARIDAIGTSLLTVVASGSEIAKDLLEGVPVDGSFDAWSRRLGKEIGEAAWRAALASEEAKSVMTPEQVERMHQHRAEGIAKLADLSHRLVDGADDLAALWGELDLSPAQVDALGVVHKYAVGRRHAELLEKQNQMREKIGEVLTTDQAAAEDFHRMRRGGWLAHLTELAEARERFRRQLGLTGVQKIALVETMIDNRHAIAMAIQGVVKPWFELQGAIHADSLDHSGIRAAADELGASLVFAARTTAGVAADAAQMLTAHQRTTIHDHLNQLLDRHLARAERLPDRVRQGIGLLRELELTEEQKERIMRILVEFHLERTDGHTT